MRTDGQIQSSGHPDQVGEGISVHLARHLPRCALTVISLIPSSLPTCLFNRPDTINQLIWWARALAPPRAAHILAAQSRITA